jgi:NitT/TauT family transport system substrate-binding protein
MCLALLAFACGPGPTSTDPAPAAPAAPAAQSGGTADGVASSAASAPASLMKVRSGYTTIAAAVAPWWVALDGGYFREQGLDVELNHIDAGAPLLAALSNGELDITQAGAPSLVLGYLQGLETVLIGSTSNVLDAVVFTRPEIQTVEDLRGKTIGVTSLKAITDVGARLGLRRMGLEPDVDVFTRKTGGLAESLAGLETGAIDGASLNVPAVFEARKRGYRELIDVTKLGIPFLGTGVGATKKTLAARPELGEPYLRALAQAVSRIQTDRDFALQAIGKYSQTEDQELLGNTVDYYRPLYTVDPYPEPAAVQSVLDVEEHPGARSTAAEDVIDTRFGEQLRRSGFLDHLPRGQ